MKMHSGRLIGGVLVATAIFVSVTMTAAQARDFHFFVSGSGTTQDPDRRAALDEAYDKASEQARLVCAGGNGQIRHDRIDRTGSSCLRAGEGDNAVYSCMVFVRADCVSRVR